MLAVPPALTVAVIWSMPAMPLSAFSIGMMTADVISSGAAPGQPERHVDGRRIGLREQIDAEIAEREDAQHDERHHEHRGEDRPPDAEFRQHGYSVSAVDGHLHAVGQVVDVGERDRARRASTPPRISMRSPTRSPVFSSWTARRSPVDDEHAIDAVAVLHRGVGNRQHLFDQRGVEVHAREGARLEPRVVVRHRALRTRTRASAC